MGEQISQDISIPPSNTSSTLLLLTEKLVMEKGPHECVRAYQIEWMALRPVSVSKALVDFIYRPSRSTHDNNQDHKIRDEGAQRYL